MPFLGMKSIGDKILTHFFMWNDFDTKRKLKIEKEITNKEKNKKAILFFPFWTGKSSIYKGLAKKFPDYTLVFYDYPNEVLSEDVDVSIKYLKEIIDDATELIKQLKKEKYKEIILIGSSLGSNIAIKLSTISEVDKVIVNMVDRTLAKEIFYSPALKKLKKKLQRHKFTLQKLDKIYDFVSTENNIHLIKNKKNIKFLIFESKTDIFCTLDELEPVLNKFKKNKIHYRLKINKFFGHILSIYKNLIFNKPIVNFIKE